MTDDELADLKQRSTEELVWAAMDWTSRNCPEAEAELQEAIRTELQEARGLSAEQLSEVFDKVGRVNALELAANLLKYAPVPFFELRLSMSRGHILVNANFRADELSDEAAQRMRPLCEKIIRLLQVDDDEVLDAEELEQ